MKRIILIFFALVYYQCSTDQNQEIIAKCKAEHDLAIKTSNQFVEKLSVLESASRSDSTQVPLDSIIILKEEFEVWKLMVVEPPGHQHGDDHDHHGHHHNEPPVELTPEMNLEVQTHLKETIVRLESRAQKFIDQYTKP
ncbi:MAG: hypothetical protein NXI20_03580 [bacterium]|nr:hypothetical protein [bacterium]